MWGEGWGTMLLDASFFFSWGAFYGIRGLNPLNGIHNLWPVALIYLPLAIADVLTKGWEYNIFIHKAGIVLGIVAIFYIATYLVETGKARASALLAGSSFLVFALHTLVMDDIGKVLFTALHLPINMGTLLLLYFIVPSITILFCLVVYLVLKRIAPPLCRLLTGGR